MTLKQVNIRLEDDLIKKVKKICIDKDISFQDAVKEALEGWIKKP